MLWQMLKSRGRSWLSGPFEILTRMREHGVGQALLTLETERRH